MNTGQDLSCKAITVLGLINGEDIGFTLPHEHLLSDISVYFAEPSSSTEKQLAYQPLSSRNLRWVRYHIRNHLDNARLWDENLAIEELMSYKLAGGNTLVEQSSRGLGRDPKALARISRATGIHIIMGTGHYVTPLHDLEMDRETEDQLAEEIVSDITTGAEGTGLRSGIIGEIGCSWPLREKEKKALRAAAYAQQQTGLAINVHPSRNENGPMGAIQVLQEAGANLERVVVSHMDRCGYLLETRLKILEAGCYVEYDLFGLEGGYPTEAALADGHLPDMPNDVGRIKEIADLIRRGYLKRILISHDICYKVQLACWGGPGYAHILENVLPLMKIYGYSQEQIHSLTVENPKDMLTVR
jgi:phosphotriesterase-related protein